MRSNSTLINIREYKYKIKGQARMELVRGVGFERLEPHRASLRLNRPEPSCGEYVPQFDQNVYIVYTRTLHVWVA